MTQAEMFEVLFLAAEQMNSNFEFWISGTFAIIVAFFFAGQKIPKSYRVLMSILYLIFTAIVFIRFIFASSLLVSARDTLREMNPDLVMEGGLPGDIAGALYLILFIAGTLCTLVFVSRHNKILKELDEDDT